MLSHFLYLEVELEINSLATRLAPLGLFAISTWRAAIETRAIAFAVGVSVNKTPEFIGIYPGISNQKEGLVIQGKSPKNIVTIPEIGFRDMYVVSNRKQFDEIKWFIDLINPEKEFKDLMNWSFHLSKKETAFGGFYIFLGP